MLRALLSVLVRSSCASRPPEAGDFALRAPSVSPLDHAKGRRPLTPRKILTHFSVKKIMCLANYDSCRTSSPAAVQLRKLVAAGEINKNCARSWSRRRNPRYGRVLSTGGVHFSYCPRNCRIQDGSVFKSTRLFPYAVFYIPVGRSMKSVSTSKCSETSRMTASTPGVSER